MTEAVADKTTGEARHALKCLACETRWEPLPPCARYRRVAKKFSPGALIVALLAVGLAIGIAVGQAAPSIQVVPSPVGRGQIVTVYGRDFCGSPPCSRVKITLNDAVLTTELEASGDGTFSFAFVASQVPDLYRVTAQQTSVDGSSLEASYGLLIIAPDLPPGETPAPFQTLPPGATARPEQGGGTSSPSSTPAGTTTLAATDEARPIPSAPASANGDGASVLPWVLGVGFSVIVLVLIALAGWRLRTT